MCSYTQFVILVIGLRARKIFINKIITTREVVSDASSRIILISREKILSLTDRKVRMRKVIDVKRVKLKVFLVSCTS